MARTLEGQRVLVVGASAGIGREFALQAVAGRRATCCLRRGGRTGWKRLAAEAGGGLPVVLDITDPDSCAALRKRCGPSSARSTSSSAAPATRRCATSTTPARRTGRRVLGINVIGIHQMIRAVLAGDAPRAASSPSCRRSRPRQPRHALGVYTSSKAALEMSMRVLAAGRAPRPVHHPGGRRHLPHRLRCRLRHGHPAARDGGMGADRHDPGEADGHRARSRPSSAARSPRSSTCRTSASTRS